MRYDYDDTTYVELSERWSRREVREIVQADGVDFLDLVRQKIDAICLPGITSPDQLTDETVDEMDWQLWRWFAALPIAHLNHLYDLGEARRRRLLGIPDDEKSSQSAALASPEN